MVSFSFLKIFKDSSFPLGREMSPNINKVALLSQVCSSVPFWAWKLNQINFHIPGGVYSSYTYAFIYECPFPLEKSYLLVSAIFHLLSPIPLLIPWLSDGYGRFETSWNSHRWDEIMFLTVQYTAINFIFCIDLLILKSLINKT